MPAKSVLSFHQWMNQVDREITKRIGFGLTSADLPDCPWYDWFEHGTAPTAAAKRAIRYAKGAGEF